MKTSRATVEANRQKVLEAASEGFRRKGFDGLRVADIMRGAGLTHGGFYNYFESKEDLAAQACDLSLKRQVERLGTAGAGHETTRRAALEAYITRYLSGHNRDHPESACLFPSLAADVARQSGPVRKAFTQGVDAYVEALGGLAGGRVQAIMTLSALVGAMVLARGVDDAALSDDILTTVREGLIKPEGGV